MREPVLVKQLPVRVVEGLPMQPVEALRQLRREQDFAGIDDVVCGGRVRMVSVTDGAGAPFHEFASVVDRLDFAGKGHAGLVSMDRVPS
jgi:hypothetical protein